MFYDTTRYIYDLSMITVMIHLWNICDTPTIHLWQINERLWYIYEKSLIHVWYISDKSMISLINLWYIHDTSLISLRYMYDIWFYSVSHRGLTHGIQGRKPNHQTLFCFGIHHPRFPFWILSGWRLDLCRSKSPVLGSVGQGVQGDLTTNIS